MITSRPDIVYAQPPKRTRRPKAQPADMPKLPVIVEAQDPRRIKREPKLATRIVDRRAADIPEDGHHQRGDAADALSPFFRARSPLVPRAERLAGARPEPDMSLRAAADNPGRVIAGARSYQDSQRCARGFRHPIPPSSTGAFFTGSW
jgi:hypothetical protein